MISPLYGQAVIAAAIGLVAYLIKQIVKASVEMRDNVRDIMTNHLPHIYEELKGMREDIYELKERND
jgi:hypothetical protein